MITFKQFISEGYLGKGRNKRMDVNQPKQIDPMKVDEPRPERGEPPKVIWTKNKQQKPEESK